MDLKTLGNQTPFRLSKIDQLMDKWLRSGVVKIWKTNLAGRLVKSRVVVRFWLEQSSCKPTSLAYNSVTKRTNLIAAGKPA